MTEHIRREIAAAVAEAASRERLPGPDRICARLRSMTGKLRRHYEQACASRMRVPVDEWLCDNYYVLEKESRQTVRDIRRMSREGKGTELARMYGAVEGVLASRRKDGSLTPPNDETLAAMLEAMNSVQPLSERQFGFVTAAVKAALIGMVYTAVAETRDEELMSGAITGFSKLASVDLELIVQRCSGVERILADDPAGVYPLMSDDTRGYYRRLVARIAFRRGKPEQEVASELLERAKAGGYHIGNDIVGDRVTRERWRRRGALALAMNALLPLAVCVLLGLWSRSVALAVLCYLPLWEILRTPIQQLALAGVEADFIPRMDPDKLEERPVTVALVSTLLPGAPEAPALARRLEQLYFSNSDPAMYYCVLADMSEWDYPTDEKDESRIAAAKKVVEGLNRAHGSRFMLFLRARAYNPTQRRYSGWERKRGAITEFVRFLKGEKTSLHTFAGDRSVLERIKFLIALDSDTSLLYESAQTLVAAAAHPLNRPVVGDDGVVVSGYGILAPKISTDLSSAGATAFSRVMIGCGGVTAYETHDKDFYQDLFGESIFAGKGLIDVDCFYEVLDKRFPEGRILSHDILEGAYLRCAFVSDVEMTDTAPSNMGAWLSRLHRWLRGDWQNIVFIAGSYRAVGRIWRNPISVLSRYKLFDNLRRSLTPVAALLCVTAALAAPYGAAVTLALAGALAVTFPPLWASLHSLLSGGFFMVSRKFFTRALPHAFELMGQALFMLIMLPIQAFLTADAAVRSLWRVFVSRKRLLEWTTAAQSERREQGILSALRRYWAAELFGLLYLSAASHSALSLLGICFALILPVALFSARRSADTGGKLTPADRETLVSYNAAMWRYYEKFADKKNHFLPPDNIQQSPVYRVAARTSPTNIGMLLLSILAARDFDFIDTDGLYERINRTLATVEELPRWHGNLYNWYDTETLDTLKPEFISTVDSGNFVCCLVALKEGLRAFTAEKPEMNALIRRIEAVIDATDLTVFYDRRKRLFSIGYDVPTGKLVNSHYDFLMSEARLTSFYAVARKTVGKKHWGAMGRAMSRWGYYAGPVSWTGTMFEYFMPHLLLPVYDGSLLGESLNYCIYCQKKRARAADVPWGISESAFYAFDNNLNYQYKAHGVQRIGVKRRLDRELVISPYSTFLTLPWSPNSAMRNLSRLRELGVYGRYGFFEAVDFTSGRVGAGGLAVTRSYMAHHIGMSMVSSVNALFDMRMQRRFMADNHMNSAREFLQEKIARDAVVYGSLNSAEAREEKQERPRFREEKRDPNPLAPRFALLTNGELTDVLTDIGAGWLQFGDIDVTRRDADLLRRAQGVFTLVRMGGVTLSASSAPFYDHEAVYSIEQQEQSVTYLASKRDVELGVRCLIHPTISCQQRQIVVKNRSGSKLVAETLCYLEPVLASYRDYSAHPAYSKLFVTASYDAETKTLTYARRGRDGDCEMFMTVGFLQEIDFSFETRREALMSAPNGMDELFRFHGKTFSSAEGGVPDACCAVRFDLLVPAGGQQQVTLLLSAARTAAEGVQNIIAMRKIGVLEPKNAARSPLLSDSLEARLGAAALGPMLFGVAGGAENRIDMRENRLGQNALWPAGVSGDLPIALIELERDCDLTTLDGYLRLHTAMRGIGLAFDLVVFCAGPEQREQCRELTVKHSEPSVIGARGGVFLLEADMLPPETRTLFRASARHIAGAAQSCPPPYRPMRIRSIAPATLPKEPELAVEGGCFDGGRFYVDKSSPLPWSHVLANPVFGTLVSDCSPGYTWAVSSRENKLTPWYNDIATGNDGEMLLLSDGDGVFSLTRGARASFSRLDARYEGHASRFTSLATITVSGKGCAKYIDVTLKNRSTKKLNAECVYYIEPVLGVNRDTARHVRTEAAGEGVLALHNPYNTAVSCWAVLAGEGGGPARLVTDRGSFLSGDWQNTALDPSGDPCAAVILPVSLPAGGEARLRFTLAYGRDRESALRMAQLALPAMEPVSLFEINTPDKCLNQFINHFAPHQILAGRIYGRTAFYQCGGAYGFRDQLQDVCAYLPIDPIVAKRQIARCAAVQFEEGDVLHWWHNLPAGAGGLKGVRTRFSDDLLWLPYAVALYVKRTGDSAILDMPVRYLHAPELESGEQEKYISPERSSLKEDIFEHCLRAIERGSRLDERGLPFIGCGDWNDGFSSVGRRGKGVSVWLAMFLAAVLERFAEVCAIKGRHEFECDFLDRAQALRRAVDAHCWDGEWYIRAFFDDGEPMGSHHCEECRIDLLPQSFAVFSGMPDAERVDVGLQSALDRLVDHKLRIVKLFDPPFRDSAQQPGYVKAYPGGVRENGGQYTHSAVWFAMALLERGRVEEGWRILEMLNPVNRAANKALAARYKLEPYYIAADIYSNPGAAGRGGWPLYTGASSWYYRAVVETLLGLDMRGDRLIISPKLPDAWPCVSIQATLRETRLAIRIARDVPSGLTVDGKASDFVPLDGGRHNVTFNC